MIICLKSQCCTNKRWLNIELYRFQLKKRCTCEWCHNVKKLAKCLKIRSKMQKGVSHMDNIN